MDNRPIHIEHIHQCDGQVEKIYPNIISFSFFYPLAGLHAAAFVALNEEELAKYTAKADSLNAASTEVYTKAVAYYEAQISIQREQATKKLKTENSLVDATGAAAPGSPAAVITAAPAPAPTPAPAPAPVIAVAANSPSAPVVVAAAAPMELEA